MGPKQKTVTVTEALTRNLAPLLEMKVNQEGIPTALEPQDILSFLHEMEHYNAQRTDITGTRADTVVHVGGRAELPGPV